VGPEPGDLVQVRFTKWGGGRHWEFPVTVLGTDEHGVWGGGAIGTHLVRPGAAFDSEHRWVTLFPHDRPWSASFYGAGHPDTDVYVDMTTVPVWDGARVSLVDLDLDVILLVDGCLVVDDEDEFDEHRVALGYPEEIVELARRSAADLMSAAGDGREPFGDAARGWLHARTDAP
jgi:uncharacterized protein